MVFGDYDVVCGFIVCFRDVYCYGVIGRVDVYCDGVFCGGS